MLGVYFTLMASLITILQKATMVGPDQSALLPIILMGIGYSVYESAFWVSVAYTVPKHLTGAAYGLATCFSGLAGVAGPIIVAQLQVLDVTSGGVQRF